MDAKQIATLGTQLNRFLAEFDDCFGRSESRSALRSYFGVDAATIAWAALVDLSRQGQVSAADLRKARQRLGIDADRVDPLLT